MQPLVLEALRNVGHEVYDFRNPGPNENGFAWSWIDEDWLTWTLEAYLEALKAPVAEHGFGLDFDAMKWADCGVLLLPCGRSAHLEGGYFVGAKKPLHILLSADKFEPELMYKMADTISVSLQELIHNLGGSHVQAEVEEKDQQQKAAPGRDDRR